MKVRTIVVIVLFVLFIIFVLQNIQNVTVSFLTISLTMPRAILLSFTLIVGILIGVFIPRKKRKS